MHWHTRVPCSAELHAICKAVRAAARLSPQVPHQDSAAAVGGAHRSGLAWWGRAGAPWRWVFRVVRVS